MAEQTETKSESGALGIAIRQVLAIVGAFSLLGLIKDLMTWQHDIGLWIDAFRAFTRPVATFLFGWIPNLLGLSFPGWLKDYLTVGLVVFAGCMRAIIASLGKDYNKYDISTLIVLTTEFPNPFRSFQLWLALFYLIIASIIFWPPFLIYRSLRTFFAKTTGIDTYPFGGYNDNPIDITDNSYDNPNVKVRKRMAMIILSVFVYFGLIIAANYAFIHNGASVGG